MSSTAIPALRYRDAPRMIRWLQDAFGFQANLVVPGENGSIAHAQLTLGAGMIMLGSARDDAFGKLQVPAQTDAPVTQSTYLIIADTDGVYQRAQAAGATIVMPIRDEDHGGRGFGCRDPEGHLWYIGSYDPWAAAHS